jgi:hypothetical protein
MWRKNAPDPYGVAELKRIIPEIIWARAYIKAMARKYSELFKSPTDPADKQGAFTASLVRCFLDSPLAFFMKTESPERDPTWLQSLPNEAQRCFMKHALDVSQGLYQPEIKGALAGTSADKYSVDKFHNATRVNQRFTTSFLIAYDSLNQRFTTSFLISAATADAAAGPGDDSAAAKAAESASQKQESQAEMKKQDSRETDLSAFRRQCEMHCLRELEARLVLLVAEGTHAEIKASVTTTRLYQNLTENVPCMGFYDVKNAKLCDIFKGEGVLLFTVFPTSCSNLVFRTPRSKRCKN